MVADLSELLLLLFFSLGLTSLDLSLAALPALDFSSFSTGSERFLALSRDAIQ
jgi:hypothetical protein